MKIFVSSTFKDMHAERDMLTLYVRPEIQEFLRNYGEELTFIDLRWGINTQSLEEEESAHKILSVCLDEIDRSKPFFIAFLGERYGWIPDKRLIEETVKQKSPEFSYLAEFEKSVTALEIEYALAQKDFADRCLFYFRKPLPIEKLSPEYRALYCSEGEGYKRRLDALKSKIISSGGRVWEYTADWDEERNCVTGLDELKERIISDLKMLIKKDFGEKKRLPWQKEELKQTEFFIKQKLNHFSAREKLSNEITDEIFSGSSNLIMVKGPYGYGKSTMMAKLAANARERKANVLPIICGLSRNTSDYSDVWRQIAFYLEELLKLPHKEEEKYEHNPIPFDWKEWTQHITGLFNSCSEKLANPIVILIDGVDQISYFRDFQDFLKRLLRRLPKNIVFVLSCVNNLEILSKLGEKIKYSVYTLGDLATDEKELVLDRLEFRYKKELPLEVKSQLLVKGESNNPLYLYMMYDRMLMLDSDDFKEISRLGDGMEGQREYMLRLIADAPGDIDGVAMMIMEEAASRINKELCSEVLKLIAVTRRGLREDDLKFIFKKRSETYDMELLITDFYLLKKNMSSYFFERNDGRIDFAYENFRSGILKNLSEQELKQLNEEVFLLLDSLSDKDPVHRDEYAWFAWKCDKKSEFLMRIGSRYDEWWLLGYSDPIAKGLHDICMYDKGEWLVDMLKDLAKQDPSSWSSDIRDAVARLYKIIRLNFLLDFRSSEETKVLMPIVEQVLQIAEYMAEKYKTPESVDNLRLLSHRIGYIYQLHKMYDKALAYYNKTLGLYDVWGPDVNGYESIYENIADLYNSWGKHDQALEYYRKTIESYELKAKQIFLNVDFSDLVSKYEKAVEFCESCGMYHEMAEFQDRISSIKELEERIHNDRGVNPIFKFEFTSDRFQELMDDADEAKSNGKKDEALLCYGNAFELLEEEIKRWNKTENLKILAELYDRLAVASESVGNRVVSQECLHRSQKIRQCIDKESDDGEWYYFFDTKWQKLKVD